jgi:signal transduction histidine kinase/CheY-like chemotaxis protein
MLLALLWASQAAAATVTIGIGEESIDLGESFDHRADPTGRLGVAEVAADAGAFRTAGRRELNRGFTGGAHWLRLTLVNAGDAPATRWLEIGHARLQWVRAFWREGGAWREAATGTHVPRGERPVLAATPVLPLTLAPREERTVLIQVATETAVDLNARLWEPLAFRSAEALHFLGRGAFLSGLLLTAGLALLIWMRLDERVYLLFALALFFQAAHGSVWDGLFQRYLWPGHLPFATSLILVFAGMALFFHGLFMREFLGLRQAMPFWHRVMTVLAGLGLLCAPGASLHDFAIWARVATFDALAMVALASTLSLILAWRGSRPARFFVAGMFMLWLSVIVSQGMLLGLLPLWTPLRDSMPAATVLASSLILLAVTERTRETQAALVEARAAKEAQSSFLARMSHELRTPLNTVIGFARMLRDGAPRLSPRQGGGAIERSGLHLLAMIDELLDCARGELGELRLAPAPTALADFIGTIAESAQAMAAETGNRFVLDVAGEPLPAAVMVDAARLRQVLDNLLANANRHTHGGQVELACRVDPGAGPGRVRLGFRVVDTGEGVAPEDRERIFEPYERGADRSGKGDARGAGLGLAISRQLVVLMGGRLALEETSPRGSTFGFAIECATLDRAAAAPPAAVPQWLADVGGGRTLLVAEDMADSRALLAGVLRAAGFFVIEAADGREALDRVDEKVDLALTDQFMPVMGGWEFLRALRERGLHMPVVLVSAAAPRRPGAFPADLDFDARLGKPLDPAALFRLLAKLLAIDGTPEPARKPAPQTEETIAPPAARRMELARLVDEGRVTEIEEWARSLARESPLWQSYSERVATAARRLDFAELARLSGGRIASTGLS